MSFTTGLIIICTISGFLIITLMWYIKRVLGKLFFVSDSMGDLLIKLMEYCDHLETVYSLETYYGDTTLQELLRHSKVVVEELKEFEEIYSLTTVIENNDDTEEYDEENDRTETEHRAPAE